jgi:hypothetical protein
VRGLALVNGDIQVGQSGYVEVTGQAKVLQDMVVAAQEPYGSDQYHPGWGSYLNNYVGGNAASTPALAQSEVKRLVSNYMTVQTYNQSQALAAGNKSPYTNDDFVTGLASLDVAQDTTSLTVNASLMTASGQTVGIAATVGS